MKRIVALDIETTGFGSNHRVVEVAVVVFDPNENKILAEFETLVNPIRNVPADSSSIHGLRAEDLSLAPTFEEIAGSLSEILSMGTLVAHNADFDLRFLNAEFSRFGIEFEPDDFICTYRLSGQSLPVACEQISYSFSHHSALEDAKAALAILLASQGGGFSDKDGTATIELQQTFRTLTRSQLGLAPMDRRISGLSRLRLDFNQTGAEQTYIGLLDAYLRDLSLNSVEELGLQDFAHEHGISAEDEIRLKDQYLSEIEFAALRDGIITESEAVFFEQIASTLGFDRRLEPTTTQSSLPPKGSLICVTGTAIVGDEHFDKKSMAAFLATNGYVFTDVISKKSGVSLLLQESEGSQSSKVAKAQSWGIPRMVIADFVSLVKHG
jgi:DNA polymerase-3 subunit epsilon